MLESRSAYHPFGETGIKLQDNETTIVVSYKTYKTKYATNKTVAGSYDSKNKTIKIIVNKDYASKLTNLGNNYSMNTYRFIVEVPNKGLIFAEFNAKSEENAIKNAKKTIKNQAEDQNWKLIRISKNYQEDKPLVIGSIDMSNGFMIDYFKS